MPFKCTVGWIEVSLNSRYRILVVHFSLFGSSCRKSDPDWHNGRFYALFYPNTLVFPSREENVFLCMTDSRLWVPFFRMLTRRGSEKWQFLCIRPTCYFVSISTIYIALKLKKNYGNDICRRKVPWSTYRFVFSNFIGNSIVKIEYK